MAIRDLLAARLAGPATRVLDAPIRDIVHEILREHGYASPAEVQAMRDELRDMRQRMDAVDRRLADTAASAVAAHDEAARVEARLASAPAEAPLAADAGRTAALELRVSELEALLTVALAPKPAPPAGRAASPAVADSGASPLSAEPRAGCKVPGCGDTVRSKGFCSPHYQQWRRGTLKGFVNADGTALIDGRVVHLPSASVGGAVTQRDGKLYVDGKPTKEVAPS